MKSPLIIAIVGMTGSGKSIASDFFVQKGFYYIRFGQITLDIIKKRGLKPIEENEREIRMSLREEYGMGAYALLNLPKIEEALKDEKNVIIDGVYSWSEYKILKERYKDRFITIAVYAPPALRYERLEKRTVIDIEMKNRPLSLQQAKARDYNEIEHIEKAGPIVMADYTIINHGAASDLLKTLEMYFQEIEEKASLLY